MILRASYVLPALLIAGCGIPADPDGTSDRLSAGAPLRAGIAGDAAGAAPAVAVIDRVARDHGTTVAWRKGPAEPLLHALEEGQIDVVIGHFARRSPWRTRVDLSRTIGAVEPDGGNRPALRLARPNGENAFIRRTDIAIGR